MVKKKLLYAQKEYPKSNQIAVDVQYGKYVYGGYINKIRKVI